MKYSKQEAKRIRAQSNKTRTQMFLDLVGILSNIHGQELLDIADEACVAPATLYFWVSGYVTHPRLSTLVRVADALGYDITLQKRKQSLRKAA